MNIERRKTRTINVGGVKIGSRFPIRIQSMTKTRTASVQRTVREIKKLEKAGCEIIRVAVKDIKDAEAINRIRKSINIPLVADIHFDYTLALEAIRNGADKIRINPGNMPDPSRLKDIIKLAKNRRIPIRIGLNSGSLPKTLNSKPKTAHRKPCLALGFAERRAGRQARTETFIHIARKYIKLFERHNFHDIIISLKSSDVKETVSAYRKLAEICDYPFHLGITAAGPYDTGIVKSGIGIGSLLVDGIGDTIRVSLTGDSVLEVTAAKRILQSLRLRAFGPDIISCPTCGRCQVNLAGIVREVEKRIRSTGHTTHDTRHTKSGRPVTIAIMGCEVNGPGEAREADIGIAFGKDCGLLFRKGKVIKKVKAKSAARELFKFLRDTSNE